MKKISLALSFILSAALVRAQPARIPDGGTNNISFTSNLLIYFDGAKLAAFPAGTVGQCILYDATPKPVNGTCVLAVSAGTGLTLGGTSTNPSLSLTTPVSIANGGTNATGSFTTNGYFYFDGTRFVSSSAGSAYQSLRVPSGGAPAAFGAVDLSQSAAVTNALGIANGGTASVTQSTNGVCYYSGSAILCGTVLTWDGSNILGIASMTPELRLTTGSNYSRHFRSATGNTETRLNHAYYAPPNSALDFRTSGHANTSQAYETIGAGVDATAYSAITIMGWIVDRGTNGAFPLGFVNRGIPSDTSEIIFSSDLGSGNSHVPAFLAKTGAYAYGSTPGGCGSNCGISLNTLHHLTGTYDGSTGATKLYVDATLQTGATASVTGVLSGVGTHGWCLADYQCSGTAAQVMDGAIDEVRIYNRVLSSGEISTCYSTPLSCSTSGLVHHWNLDDLNGTTAYDSVGTHNLTLNGTTPPAWIVPGLVADQNGINLDTVYLECSDGAASNEGGQCSLGNPPTDATNAQTTLSGNGGSITSGATSMLVASSSSFPTAVPFFVQVESESIKVTAISSLTWTIARAQSGTTAASHSDGKGVYLLDSPNFTIYPGTAPPLHVDSWGVDLNASPVETEMANDTSTGTLQYFLAKQSSGKAILATTSDTGAGVVIGVCAYGCGVSGSARVVTFGQATGYFDGATTQDHFVQASTTVGGALHDAGSSYPATGAVLGKIRTTNGAAGYFTYDAYPQGTGSGQGEALLDGAVHSDTAAGSVVRGDVIAGNSTPKWARVAKGASGTFVGSDGTDTAFRHLDDNDPGFSANANGDANSSHHGYLPAGDGNSSHVLLGNVTWGASPGGGGTTNYYGSMVQLAQTVTTGSQSTVTFSSIPGGYTDLYVTFQARDTASATSEGLYVKVNSDATSGNYQTGQYLLGTGSGSTANQGTLAGNTKGLFVGNIAGGTAEANATGAGSFVLPAYSGTTFWKHIVVLSGYDQGSPAEIVIMNSQQWKSTAAITSLVFSTAGTAFVNGSTITLYGSGGASGLNPAVNGVNGALQQSVENHESTTLSGATTDTAGNLLAAPGQIAIVNYRITTTITGSGVTGFQIGDASTAARFCGTQSTLTAGTTGTCLAHLGTSSVQQAAAAKVRFTGVGGSFSGGVIEIEVFAQTSTPPTS